MPSFLYCPGGHRTRSIKIRDAAISLSEGKAIGSCEKHGRQLQCRIEHTYGNDPEGTLYEYVVTRAIRLKTRLADDEEYDPFLLVLTDRKTGKEQILPTFWAFGKSGTQRGGQFPPLLSLREWKRLFSQLRKRRK